MQTVLVGLWLNLWSTQCTIWFDSTICLLLSLEIEYIGPQPSRLHHIDGHNMSSCMICLSNMLQVVPLTHLHPRFHALTFWRQKLWLLRKLRHGWWNWSPKKSRITGPLSQLRLWGPLTVMRNVASLGKSNGYNKYCRLGSLQLVLVVGCCLLVGVGCRCCLWCALLGRSNIGGCSFKESNYTVGNEQMEPHTLLMPFKLPLHFCSVKHRTSQNYIAFCLNFHNQQWR